MWGEYFMKYDVIIIGAGPGGIFSAYELMKKAPDLKVAVFEEGNTLEKRKCPKSSRTFSAVLFPAPDIPETITNLTLSPLYP